LIGICQRVNFDCARYRRPGEYSLIAERAGPLAEARDVPNARPVK
jgi:hypothetical protein